ncbi:MAG: periplasmic heavy metal sensor [Candidatus Schekmanbacteria bacterium]|nr:periplasmic heavy metal sensor [Candidatus Schekmanbacteria bacterium]
MSKKMILGLTGAVILLVGTGVMIASAKHCKDKQMEMGEGESGCLPCERKECAGFYLDNKEALGLSDEQVAKMKELQLASRKVKIHNMAEVDVLKLELNALLDAKKPDLTEIDAKVDKISQLKAETMKNCLQASVKAREVLTEEQTKLAEGLKKACIMSPGGHDRDDEKPPCKMKKD